MCETTPFNKSLPVVLYFVRSSKRKPIKVIQKTMEFIKTEKVAMNFKKSLKEFMLLSAIGGGRLYT